MPYSIEFNPLARRFLTRLRDAGFYKRIHRAIDNPKKNHGPQAARASQTAPESGLAITGSSTKSKTALFECSFWPSETGGIFTTELSAIRLSSFTLSRNWRAFSREVFRNTEGAMAAARDLISLWIEEMSDVGKDPKTPGESILATLEVA